MDTPILGNDYVMFALGAIIIFTVYMTIVSMTQKNPMRERLKRVLAVDMPGVGYAYEDNRSGFLQFCTNLLTAIGVDLGKAKRDLYVPLARAGLMRNDAVVYYLFFTRFVQPVLLVFAALAFLQLITMEDRSMSRVALYFLIGGLCALFGLRGAKLYLSNAEQKRKKELQLSFPDALDLILVCVESGLPLDSALARVCREMKDTHPTITEELDRTRVELSVLNDRVQALENLALRTDTPGFKNLVSSLSQAEKVGSSIADTLRVLSDEYRVTRMLMAENKAARIPVLITIPMIVMMLFSLFPLILGPAFIRVSQQGGIMGPSESGASR